MSHQMYSSAGSILSRYYPRVNFVGSPSNLRDEPYSRQSAFCEKDKTLNEVKANLADKAATYMIADYTVRVRKNILRK